MGENEKVYQHILLRRSDSNVPFAGLCALLKKLGFEEWIREDYHIFKASDVDEILNLQPKGGKSKPYQVKQVRGLIL
jgi:hypothetical protein